VQFLVNVIDDGQAQVAGRTESATRSESDAVDAFTARLGDAVLFAAGVSAPTDAVVVDGRGGQESHRPGPVSNTPGYVAGFWVVELPDVETALRTASEASAACNRRVELRPVL